MAKKKEPLIDYPGAPYKSGDKISLLSNDGKPYAIRTVISTAKREMLVTAHDPKLAPIKVTYAEHDARTTQPGDDEAIRLLALKRLIRDLGEDSLDAEALAAVGPLLNAWRSRDLRRKRLLRARLRVALIDGAPMESSKLRLRAAMASYGNISGMTLDDLMHEIGAVNVSSGSGRIWQRTPTREDSIDACILSELGDKPNWHGMYPEELLRMLQGTVTIQPPVTADEFREARYRCGVVPGDRLVLQESEKGSRS